MTNGLDKYTGPEYLESEVAKKKAKDDGTEISDYVDDKDSALESIVSFGRKAIAGENAIGKVGGVVKDALKRFVPLGEEFDSVTDQIGDSLKTKPKINTMDKPKLLSKTVWSAIIIAMTALLQAFGVDLTADPELTVHIYETVYGLAGAFGLYGLRDAISKQINSQ